eukprot:g16350.t1
MALKAVDDVGFSIAKTATQTGGAAVDVSSSVARAAKKFDPSSLMASMPGNSFFKNLELPQVSMKTSKLFHTPDALKSLKKLNVTELVPRSTSDLLTSMSKTIDDVPKSSVDDLGKSLAKVDVGDAAAVSKVAQSTSLGKLKNLSEHFASLTKKNTNLIGRKTTKLADEAFESAPFKSADEMTDAMKKSKGLAKFSDEAAAGAKKSGKNALESTDEVADGSKSVLKKSADVVDDAAEQAKSSKLIKALEFAKKHEGKLNFAIIGSFMLVEHMNGRVDRDASSHTVDELAGDPGTEDASAAIEEAGVSAELVGIGEREEGVMTSNTVLASVIALGAASLVI